MRLLQSTLAGALLVSASADTWVKEAGLAPVLHRSLAAPEKAVLGRSSPTYARLGSLQRKLQSRKQVATTAASAPGRLTSELAVRGGAASKAEVSEDGDEESEGADEEEKVVEEEEEEEETDEETAMAVKKLLLEEGPADKVLRAAQAVGKVLGEAHSALAQAPTLGILLTNPMFAQLGASLLMMKLSKKVDYKDAKTLFKIRVFYSSSMLFIQGMYFLVRHAIWRAADSTEVVTSNALVDGLLKATSGESEDSEGDSSSSSGGGGGLAAMAAAATRSVQTAKEYDLKLVKRASAALFPNMCMMYFFHFKRDWHRAVLFAPVGPLIQLFSDPLFQIHILGRPATGPLQRPFKSAQQRLMAEMGAGKEDGEEEAGEGAAAAANDDGKASSGDASAESTDDSNSKKAEGAAKKAASETKASSDKAPRGVVVEDATSDDDEDDDDESE